VPDRQHLATLVDFWSSVGLKTGRYRGNPQAAHRPLPLPKSISRAGYRCSRKRQNAPPPVSRQRGVRM
jgi:hypothetical protein